VSPLSKPERDALVESHREAMARYNAGMDAHAGSLGLPGEIGIDESSSAYVETPAYRQARDAQAAAAAIETEYFRRLPRLPIAPCPECGQVLHRSLDPFGLDGLWWRSDARPEEPPPCPHFCVLLGAVSLGRHQPTLDFDVHPGPGAPFVIPRLLAQPGMVAVLAEIPLVDEARAYPVAYFAARRPPVQSLTAPWPRTNFVYTTQLGEHRWRASDEPFDQHPPDVDDFDLRPWLDTGQLRWCEPGTNALGSRSADHCPYLDHPGRRQRQVLSATGTAATSL
jgi:hypothetical protein